MFETLETIDTIRIWVEAYKEHMLVLLIVLSVGFTLLERYLKNKFFINFTNISIDIMFISFGLFLIVVGIMATGFSGNAAFAFLAMGVGIMAATVITSYLSYRSRKKKSRK